MAGTLSVKRGDTFFYYVTWIGATASELKSQVRTDDGVLVSDVVIEATDSLDTFKCIVANTTNWPIGILLTDIQRTSSDNVIKSSDTMRVSVIKDVTFDE